MSKKRKVRKLLGQLQRAAKHEAAYPPEVVEGEDGWPAHVPCGNALIDPGSFSGIGGITHWYCCGPCQGHWKQEPPDFAWVKIATKVDRKQ